MLKKTSDSLIKKVLTIRDMLKKMIKSPLSKPSEKSCDRKEKK